MNARQKIQKLKKKRFSQLFKFELAAAMNGARTPGEHAKMETK
jgi:hypothetical protein